MRRNLWSPRQQQLQHEAPIHMFVNQTAALHSRAVMSRSAYVALEGILSEACLFLVGISPYPWLSAALGITVVLMSCVRLPRE